MNVMLLIYSLYVIFPGRCISTNLEIIRLETAIDLKTIIFFIIFPHFLSILIVLEVEDTYLSELFLKVKKQTKKQEDLEKTRFVVVSAVSSV